MKKLFTLTLLFLILILSGCQPKSTSKTEQKTAEKKKNIPQGWVKYENADHKLSFYYPSQWQLKPEIERKDLLTLKLEFNDTSQEQKTFWDNTLGYPYYSLLIRVEDNPENMPALDWAVKQYLPESQAEMKAKYTPATIESYEFITSSGPVTPAGVYFDYQICPGNNKAYLFIHQVDALKQTEGKYLPEVEKILTSLEFVN